MKISKKLLAVVGVLFAGYALAAAFNGPFAGIDHLVRWLKGGVYIGSAATVSTTNKITKSYQNDRFDWDFPACPAYAAAAGATICHQNTPAFALTGAAVGDVCFVNTNLTIADGGLINDVTFDTAPVSTNLVVVRMHVSDTDAGTTNVGDAGFFVRCFSNQ